MPKQYPPNRKLEALELLAIYDRCLHRPAHFTAGAMNQEFC